MIDKELEEQFKREKHMNVQLKEKIKECELEKLNIMEQLELMNQKHDVIVVSKDVNDLEFSKVEMTVTEYLNYRGKVIKELEQVERDLMKMHEEEDNQRKAIYDFERNIAQIRLERNKLAEDVRRITSELDSQSSTMMNDKD